MTGYKNPPRRRTPEFHLQRCNANLAPLAARYRAGASWEQIGAEIGLSGATVYNAVVKSKIPVNRRARRALGLIKPQRPSWLTLIRREQRAAHHAELERIVAWAERAGADRGMGGAQSKQEAK